MKKFLHLFYQNGIVSLYPVSTIYIYFVFIGLYCIDDHRLLHPLDFIEFVLFHILLTYTFAFYMKLITGESKNTTIIFPHTSGEQEEPDLSDINPFIAREITKKTYDNVRTCMICHAYKPPRSHHCHVCNRCFLKMDHHCPQLGKCIEFHNYKCFVQFLAANSVFSLMTLISLVMRLFERNPAFLISYLIAVLIVGVDFVVSSGFAIFHVNLVLKNETTVEHSALNEIMNGSFNRTTVFQEGPVTKILDAQNLDRKHLNPYCLSKMQNWKEVFGENKIQWFLPSDSSLGNGINFPKNIIEEMFEII